MCHVSTAINGQAAQCHRTTAQCHRTRSRQGRASPCRLRPTYEDVWRAVRRNFVSEAPERTLQVPDVWIVGNATDILQADSTDSCEVRRIYILMTASPEDCLHLYRSSSLGRCCCQR